MVSTCSDRRQIPVRIRDCLADDQLLRHYRTRVMPIQRRYLISPLTPKRRSTPG
jgi:hypothetical protein